MKKTLLILFFFLFLTCPALAEDSITLNQKELLVGEILDVSVEIEKETSYVYTLSLNDKMLIQSEVTNEKNASYIPKETGAYTLTVQGQTTKRAVTSSFSVIKPLKVSVQALSKIAFTGEETDFTVQVEGGKAQFTYVYSIIVDNRKIDEITSDTNTLSYVPNQTGALSVSVTVSDQGTDESTALSSTIEVKKGKGLSIKGNTKNFPTQGGIRQWTVYAPSIWSLKTEGDFFTVDKQAGNNQDTITISCTPSYGAQRSGTIVLSSQDITLSFPVKQTKDTGEEEETYLFAQSDDFIYIDGAQYASWMDNETEKTFYIQASEDFTYTYDQNLLTVTQDNDLITVIKNADTFEKEAVVSFVSGDQKGALYVFEPSAQKGAEVRSLSLDKEKAVAYKENVLATVTTSNDAQSLHIYASNSNYESTFPRGNLKENTQKELTWKVPIVPTIKGAQSFLVVAKDKDGQHKNAQLFTIEGIENTDLLLHTPLFVEEEKGNTLYVTLSSFVNKIRLLDNDKKEIQAVDKASVFVDTYVNEQNRGAMCTWNIPLKENTFPAYVEANSETQAVKKAFSPKQEKKVPALYSQSDGTWENAPYKKSTLQTSGCAIFALSHALDRLGYQGDEISPQALAKEYAFCLVDGGTLNSTLIGNAGDDLGYKTRYELYEDYYTIKKKLEEGAMFSFAVVAGHIAMVDGISEDGTMFHIVDSAPSATFERIKKAQLYIKNTDGTFSAVTALNQIPNAKYYFETNAYGALEYYLESSYVTKRGVRLIQKRAK